MSAEKPLSDEEQSPAQTEFSDDKDDSVQTSAESDHIDESTVVDFDSPTDKANPQNWSSRHKWTIIVILSAVNTIGNLATVLCLPAVPAILRDFNTTNSYYSIILASAWEAGEAAGPLLTAPLSEIFGRSPVYNATNILFVVFSVACAVSSSPGMLIGFRFLSGMGDASIALNASIAGDLFVQERRGLPIAVLSFPPLIGPVLGPVIGGYLTQAAGWRWAFWFSAIVGGAFELAFLVFFRETYTPRILREKARRLRKSTGDPGIRSRFDFDVAMSKGQIMLQGLLRPVRMFLKPVVFVFSMQVSIAYGCLYVLLTTLTEVFESTYGFSQGAAGLSFIGLSIGMVVGVLTCALSLDRLLARHRRKTGDMKPETRLLPMVVGTVLFPLGLFFYGWSAQYRLFYVVPMIGTATVGFGFFITNIPLQAYFVDIFHRYAASAIAATIVVRCIVATVLPLAAPPLYQKLGLGWGNSVLGFVAVAFVPVPIVMMRVGERLRRKNSVT